jgi:hypothetical protein
MADKAAADSEFSALVNPTGHKPLSDQAGFDWLEAMHRGVSSRAVLLRCKEWRSDLVTSERPVN